jgi:hypothetical protein
LHFILTVTLTLFCREIGAKEVACERFADYDWTGSVGNVKTCFSYVTTVINEPGATFCSTNYDTLALSFCTNINVHFLPIAVAEKFPNLQVYALDGCSIKDVTKRNFESLAKLKILWLGRNPIEKINSDTFEDLVSLEGLWMRKQSY